MVLKEKGLQVVTESDSSDESDVPEDNFGVDEDENNDEEIEQEEESDSSSEDEETKRECKIVKEGNEENDRDNLSEEDDEHETDDDNHETDDDHETDDEAEEGNAGWADAMAKVLAMGKNSDKKVSVLSKAKKDNIKKTVKSGDNVEGDSEEVIEKKYEPLAVRKARKRELDSIGRKMPNVLEKYQEKALAKIATRGVVQLFNAVRDHQKDIKSQLKEAGGSFRKQEKVFKNIDKNSFVEILTGKPMSKSLCEPPPKKLKTEVKNEKDENQSSWNILRDDFMLGAKMRDWDKESDGE